MKKWLFCLVAVSVYGAAFAVEPDDYQACIFSADNGVELKYRALLPENYDNGRKYPLVLFLHGSGERGDDNLAQLKWGGGIFSNPVNREKYPAVVLFPQCPEDAYWALDERPIEGFAPDVFPENPPVTPMLTALKELVESYTAGGKIDTKRIYIVGLSMGGMAVFDMVCRWPDMFAAAVPICGGVATERLQTAVKVPFRIFAGDADDTVPVANSRLAYLALKKYGGRVEYIEFPGVGHDSWNYAFRLPDFMEWLFAQHK